jgi:hypothetical protein
MSKLNCTESDSALSRKLYTKKWLFGLAFSNQSYTMGHLTGGSSLEPGLSLAGGRGQ